MASFDTAYNTYIKPNEGGYAFVAGDKGGETYAGIARNFFPSWAGWSYIDSQKGSGTIKQGKIFSAIQNYVDQFYRDWWNSKLFGQINSQDIANFLFDYNVNSGATAIKAIQRIVGVTADGAMGPVTIAAINKGDAAKIYTALKADRAALFERLAKEPGQSKFYDGWMNRLKKFPDYIVPGIGIMAVIVTIGVVVYLFSIQDKPAKQKIAVSSE
jgi:lysozyme family protein